MKYPYQNLNPTEFEALCCDIFGINEGVRVECFKPGKDQGIDGRAYDKDGKKIILQCKHYVVSGFEALIASLKKEVPKVEKLAPTRYIVFTSVQLSPANKDTILGLLGPYLCRTDDIWGATEIDSVLEDRPEVLRKHHKLWLLSESVLSVVLNSVTYERSKFILDEIKEDIPKYVYTVDYDKARKQLHDKKCLIITGAPGIGKTTLARMLCYDCVCGEEYECFFVNTVQEAEKVFNTTEKQIFYFDDFMGANFLAIQENKNDSQIVSFVRRITKSPNKRFILTTRTNIMNAAMGVSQIFSDANIRRNEYCVEIKNLSFSDKAKMLYNHIYISDMEMTHKNVFLSKPEENAAQTYWMVIKHANFNPRIISYITQADKFKSGGFDAKSFYGYILDSLENPQYAWKHCFENDIPDTCLFLVVLIFLNGRFCGEELLEKAFGRFWETKLAASFKGPRHFTTCIDILIKALVNRTINRSRKNLVFYTLFDPSIGDYILGNYMKEDLIYPALWCLRTPESIVYLASLCRAQKTTVHKKRFCNSLLRLFSEIVLPEHLKTDYAFVIIHTLLEHGDETTNEQLYDYLLRLDLKTVEISQINHFLDCFCMLKNVRDEDSFSVWKDDMFIDWLLGLAKDRNDVLVIHERIKRINGEEFSFPEWFYEELSKKYSDEMGAIADDCVTGDDFAHHDQHGWDYSGVRETLMSVIEAELSDYGVEYTSVDINSCIDSLDFDERRRILFADMDDEVYDKAHDEGYRYSFLDEIDRIDSMFAMGFER